MARRATVRLQLHAGFTLHDAREQIPYYAGLGVSHYYLSPISCAVPGSSHGYDVIDPGRVNPELGGEAALQALADALRGRNMGILLDIVPNHMATHSANRWWWDVLARGPKSDYAHWFDIDWQSPDDSLQGKVLAPFLQHDYAESLERGELRLVFDEQGARFLIKAGEAPFPVAQETLAVRGRTPATVLDDHDPARAEGRQRLHELLERQHYRLSGWRRAAELINWRRFFEVSGLIGVRIEKDEVFDAVHELPLSLYGRGLVDGLRIDHVDGLARPLSYCRRLRQAMRESRAEGSLNGAEPWLVVEKILARGETLDHRWQVDGTTGYDFMDEVGAVLCDPRGAERLVELWREISRWPQSAAQFVREARLTMLRRHFVAERTALTRSMQRLLNVSSGSSNWPQQKMDRVLEAFLAAFSVYRTYLDEGDFPASPTDGTASNASAASQDVFFIEQAAAGARADLGSDSDEAELLDLMVSHLIAVPAGKDKVSGEQSFQSPSAYRSQAVRRFQQLTPPLAAKSLEDTVFYRYAPMLSRNEVGSDPAELTVSIQEFHEFSAARAPRFSAALLATATHDHKRGEDVRARQAVLAECPEAWEHACRQWLAWRSSAAAPQTASSRAERYMLWQALIGAWPLDLSIDDVPGVGLFASRIAQWQRKALREAKQNTSWVEPDLEYEAACAQYVYELLGWAPQAARELSLAEDGAAGAAHLSGHDSGAGLLRSFHDFAQGIAFAGAVNGLAQTVLRLTVPGIPDLYQGAEFWDFSLVDPDNRRAVDYGRRRQAMSYTDADADLPALLKSWRDGRVKQAVIRRLLALRARYPDVFARGAYMPLHATGVRDAHVIAFMRRVAGRQVLIAVPRLCAMKPAQRAAAVPQIDMTYWYDTGIMVPMLRGHQVQDAFTGRVHYSDENGRLKLAELFADFPCAVLTSS